MSRQPRIILTIGDDGIIVVPHGITEASPFFASTENRQAPQEIIEFIARHPRARITLFADNLAQDYRSDMLPRLNVIDRAKLARRRLKQHFPSARLTASLRLKNGKFLMIGMHESNPVFAWAERLRARMPDIVLLPVEGARLAASLLPETATGWAMIVSRHKSGGFRQIVTRDGELIFTRLTPLPETKDGDNETIARDIKASLDYLTRHGLRNAQELSVLLLMPGNIHKAEVFGALPVRQIQSVSPHAAAQKLNLPFAPKENDNAGDLLFAASLVASSRPLLTLMLPEARQAWLTRHIGQWGLRVASVALFLALSSTVWHAGDFAATIMRAHRESALLQKTKHELARAQAEAAPVTEPLGRLRQALERRRIYAQQTPTPWQGFKELNSGTGDEAKIVRLTWKKESDAAPETLEIGLHMAQLPPDADRAETVAAFVRATQGIAHAMPDYTIVAAEPPYPSLPQESVTAETQGKSVDPIGKITLQRKAP